MKQNFVPGCSTWVFYRLSAASFSQAIFSCRNWLFISEFSKFGFLSFFEKIGFRVHKLISLTQSAFFCKKAVKCGKCIFVVFFGGAGFVQFCFPSSILSAVKISFQAKSSSKNIVARQNRAEQRVQADGLPRSVSRLFPARKAFFRFVGWFSWQTAPNANRWAVPCKLKKVGNTNVKAKE